VRIKCFGMVKDEIDLIEDWLRHALDIFGPGNVYVLDHESSDGTEAVLHNYRDVVWSRTVQASADEQPKGRLITALMHEHRNDCDLLVPLDGDEFIGLQNSWDRDGIRAEFERLDTRRYGRFKFALTYQVIPAIEDMAFPVRSLTDFSVTSYEFFGDTYNGFAKTFYSANAFARTDNGNHFGESSQPAVQHTSLWLYHYHARSLNQYRDKILKGAAFTNYWTKYRYSGHWQEAYRAHQDGRFEEYFESAQRRLPRHRRITWPAERLRALDQDPALPCRVGPYESVPAELAVAT
jgi:hypothetical protein